MPIVDYPMRRINPEESFAPYLTCQFINPKTEVAQDDIALVDTGSSACAVSAGFAKELGYNIKKGIWGRTRTASNHVQYWQHTFKIHIYTMYERGPENIFVDKNNIVLTLENVAVDVMDCDTPILLGVRDFLENYTLTANYPRRLFSIQDLRAF